jgi:hypothetical protein
VIAKVCQESLQMLKISTDLQPCKHSRPLLASSNEGEVPICAASGLEAVVEDERKEAERGGGGGGRLGILFCSLVTPGPPSLLLHYCLPI